MAKDSENTITLNKEQCTNIINNLNSAINNINTIIEYLSIDSSQLVKIKDSNEDDGLSTEIRDLYVKNSITYNQYKVLKFMFENPYFNDSRLCKEAYISYSSISQWKKNDKSFRQCYDKILLHKTV